MVVERVCKIQWVAGSKIAVRLHLRPDTPTMTPKSDITLCPMLKRRSGEVR